MPQGLKDNKTFDFAKKKMTKENIGERNKKVRKKKKDR